MVENLKIYKASYRLAGLIYRAMPEMPRKDKFLIGVKMNECSLAMLDNITLAYLTTIKMERLSWLNEFFKSFTRLQTYLRLCLDHSILKVETIAGMYPLIEDISNQFNGWKSKTSRM